MATRHVINNNQKWNTHDRKPRRDTISIVEVTDATSMKPNEQTEIELTPRQALAVAIQLLQALEEYN